MLNGRTALVVEEEFLIALDIQRMLEALGVEHTVFARTAEEAHQLRAGWPQIDLAVVEVRSHGTAAHQLVEGLRRDGVPVVLTTADIAIGKAVRAFPDLTILSKPLPEEAMTSAIKQALATRI
jgi:two-component system, response regulator PdtaR